MKNDFILIFVSKIKGHIYNNKDNIKKLKQPYHSCAQNSNKALYEKFFRFGDEVVNNALFMVLKTTIKDIV